MANWQLDMDVVRRWISKRGTGAFSLLVGCWVKPHDFDVDFDLNRHSAPDLGINLPIAFT